MARKAKKTVFIETLTNAGYTDKDLKGKSVEELETLVKQVCEISSSMDGIIKEAVQLNLFEDMIVGEKSIIADQIVEKTEEVKEVIPDQSSPKWTPYVLSLLEPSELVEGSPKVDGLKRLAWSILGPFSEDTEIFQVPSLENCDRSTTKTTLSFKNSGLSFTGCADSCAKNTDLFFAKFPVAVSESRSFARALKKALMLVQVVSFEEKVEIPAEESNTELAGNSMISSLKIMTQRVNVDPLRLAIHMGYKIEALEGLSKTQAREMSNKIGKYSTKEEQVPAEITV